MKYLQKWDLDNIAHNISGMLRAAEDVGTQAKKIFKCKILGRGCFVKGTPVLMANTFQSNQYNFTGNSFRNNLKALAVTAVMPIVAVPIQEVHLLDYAVAHETVNEGHGLTASTDDDIYLGLTDKDPYTSEQQRTRDKYTINNTDWNEVIFEEVQGNSKAKLALHNDWINKEGYLIDGVVNLNLPEQGISGPFRITSIKHIIPQKKPEDEDKSDDYSYKPVTAIFIHFSNQVYTIDFDNGESLGVTYQHPIFSSSEGGWKIAGELKIGESVLTKNGIVKIISKQIHSRFQEVYNLEIKDYHNFLVNNVGIVVHNTGNCFVSVKKLLNDFVKHKKVGAKNGAIRNGNKIDLPDGRYVTVNGKEFPDFTKFTPKSNNGTPLAAKFDDLKGNKDRLFDNNKANSWLQESGFLDEYDSYWVNQTYGSPVKLKKNGIETIYTWHHHENGKTMMLVEQAVHNSVQHIGGASLISSSATKLIDDFATLFPDPKF